MRDPRGRGRHGRNPAADCLALYAAGGGGIADSGPHHGDHRSAWCDRHGRNGGRRRNWRPAITYGYQRFDAFATLTTAPVLIVIVQLIQTLGTRPLAGCVAINRSTAPGLTRLACADRGEGAGYPRNIAVVEPGHADPTAGDQIDAMLLTQNVYLIGAKAGVTEHAALGQQIGKIPAGRAACRAFTSATRMALMRVRMASTSSCHRAFSSGSLSTCDTTGAKPRRAGVVAAHGGFQLAQHAPGGIGVVTDHRQAADALAVQRKIFENELLTSAVSPALAMARMA